MILGGGAPTDLEKGLSLQLTQKKEGWMERNFKQHGKSIRPECQLQGSVNTSSGAELQSLGRHPLG
jgi:hypothetical protein